MPEAVPVQTMFPIAFVDGKFKVLREKSISKVVGMILDGKAIGLYRTREDAERVVTQSNETLTRRAAVFA